MGNQHTVKRAEAEKKIPQAIVAKQATNGKEDKSQSSQEKIGDLPDFSQECTGCTTLRSEISKLKDKVSSIMAAKNDTDEIFEIRKMVAELTERLSVVPAGSVMTTSPAAVLEDVDRLTQAERHIKYIFEIIQKVHGTTKISQL